MNCLVLLISTFGFNSFELFTQLINSAIDFPKRSCVFCESLKTNVRIAAKFRFGASLPALCVLNRDEKQIRFLKVNVRSRNEVLVGRLLRVGLLLLLLQLVAAVFICLCNVRERCCWFELKLASMWVESKLESFFFSVEFWLERLMSFSSWLVRRRIGIEL